MRLVCRQNLGALLVYQIGYTESRKYWIKRGSSYSSKKKYQSWRVLKLLKSHRGVGKYCKTISRLPSIIESNRSWRKNRIIWRKRGPYKNRKISIKIRKILIHLLNPKFAKNQNKWLLLTLKNDYQSQRLKNKKEFRKS